MNNYKCQFCENEYSNKKILKTHQKSAKFCIEIQKGLKNKPNNHQRENLSFRCEYCDDTFTQKISLKQHYERCKIRLEKIREENEQRKNEEILELKRIIEIQKEENNEYKIESLISEEYTKKV